MNRKEYFYLSIESYFIGHGFKYVKSNSQFKSDSKCNTLIIEYSPWPEFVQVEPKYRVIIKEVERMKSKAWGSMYMKNETCGLNRVHLSEDPHDAILPTGSVEEISSSVQKEQLFYLNNVKPYFKNHSSLEYIDQFYNMKVLEGDYYPKIAHSNILNSSAVALYAAKYNKNPNYETLVGEYKKMIERIQVSLYG